MGEHHLPATLRGLTEQERQFAILYCKVGNAELAKRESGYADNASANVLLRKPHVAAAIRAEVVRLMSTEGAVIGFGGLKRIAQDTKAPAAAQVAAQKALLQGAGLLEGPAEGKESKPINEMDRDELRSFIDSKRQEIDRIERELSDRARDITPGDAPQPLDPFE